MGFLIILVVLSLLIFVHEAGHFFMAKKAGVKVLEFGFGLPPRLLGKQYKGTLYSINLLPIGGFVRLLGEEEAEYQRIKSKKKYKEKLDKIAFVTQPKKIRVLILITGALMNLLLGGVIFSMIYTVLGIPTVNTNVVQIVGIAKDSPGEKVFELTDEIVSVDGVEINSLDSFQKAIESKKSEVTKVVVLRKGGAKELEVVPRTNPPAHKGSASLIYDSEKKILACMSEEYVEGPLGVIISSKIEMQRYPFWQMPFRGAWYGVLQAYGWGVGILKGVGILLSQFACGSLPEDVGGPIEIGFRVVEAYRQGILELLNITAILSINLGIINLLPFPALDGGRLLFVGIEAVIKRRVNAKVEQAINAIGFLLLIIMLAAISIQDVVRRVRLPDFLHF